MSYEFDLRRKVFSPIRCIEARTGASCLEENKLVIWEGGVKTNNGIAIKVIGKDAHVIQVFARAARVNKEWNKEEYLSTTLYRELYGRTPGNLQYELDVFGDSESPYYDDLDTTVIKTNTSVEIFDQPDPTPVGSDDGYRLKSEGDRGYFLAKAACVVENKIVGVVQWYCKEKYHHVNKMSKDIRLHEPQSEKVIYGAKILVGLTTHDRNIFISAIERQDIDVPPCLK